jgi:hypothetical protein
MKLLKTKNEKKITKKNKNNYSIIHIDRFGGGCLWPTNKNKNNCSLSLNEISVFQISRSLSQISNFKKKPF